MVDVGRVLSSPRLMQKFTILRNAGVWQDGRFVVTESSINMSGVVTLGSPAEIQGEPVGDRIAEVNNFFSKQPIFLTSAADGITSDIILYKGSKYRVLKVSQLDTYGYYKAEATNMGGE